MAPLPWLRPTWRPSHLHGRPALQAWLKSDRERGLTQAYHALNLDSAEYDLRMAVVTADLRERRHVHVQVALSSRTGWGVGGVGGRALGGLDGLCSA